MLDSIRNQFCLFPVIQLLPVFLDGTGPAFPPLVPALGAYFPSAAYFFAAGGVSCSSSGVLRLITMPA